MDRKVKIEGRSKLDQTRAEMAAAMKHIADDQLAGCLVPDKLETGFNQVNETAVHQHTVISGSTQRHRVPVDAAGPVLFACSGEGIVEVSLYVGDILLSTTRPKTPVQAPDGRVMFMIDFLGKPLRGELIGRSLPVVVEFLTEAECIPTLALLVMDVPNVQFTDGAYMETVFACGASGPVEMTLVYTPGIVGFMKKIT